MKVRNGGGKEIPLVQGKEQWLCFAGVAMKRYPHTPGKRNPSKMVGVARGHQRADTMKPSHAHWATQDGQVMVERSDRMWSTGEGNGKPLQYS